MSLTIVRLRRVLSLCTAVAGVAGLASAAFCAVPTDIVPFNSGAYDAMAVLAGDHLLPDPMSVENFIGVTAPLRTRAEMESLVDGVRQSVQDTELTSRDIAALNFLQEYLADPQVSEHTPHWKTDAGITGSVLGEAGGQKVNGNSQQVFGDGFGTMRVYGSVGGNAYYTAGVTNRYQQRDEYFSFNTRNGRTPDDDVDQRDGLQEAYVAMSGSHGLLVDLGVKSRNWGPGYTGSMLISGDATARPGVELEAPVWLGHTLRLFHFSQVQEEYSNVGKMVYVGFRRLEHPLGGSLDLDLQESYSATKLTNPAILVLPYYLYQKMFINSNSAEPNEFNYNVQGGLTLKTNSSGDGLAYLQFFVDDIQAPKGLGLGDTVPRKVGYLLGTNQPLTSTTNVVVEYVHTDAETYTKTTGNREPLGWFVDDLPLGSTVGPNADALYGRIGQRLGNSFDLSLSGLYRHRYSDAFPAPEDGMITAALAYHLNLRQSLAVRYADFHEDAYDGTVTVPEANGGADYGVTTHQKLIALDYLIGL